MTLINNSMSREKSACSSMVNVHCVQSIVHESKAWFLDSKIWCLKEISKNQEKFNNILSNPFLQEGKYILKSPIPASRPQLGVQSFFIHSDTLLLHSKTGKREYCVHFLFLPPLYCMAYFTGIRIKHITLVHSTYTIGWLVFECFREFINDKWPYNL